jgi:hypothetical protein
MHQLNDLERKWRIFVFVVLLSFTLEAMTNLNKPARPPYVSGKPAIFWRQWRIMKDAHDDDYINHKHPSLISEGTPKSDTR